MRSRGHFDHHLNYCSAIRHHGDQGLAPPPGLRANSARRVCDHVHPDKEGPNPSNRASTVKSSPDQTRNTGWHGASQAHEPTLTPLIVLSVKKKTPLLTTADTDSGSGHTLRGLPT